MLGVRDLSYRYGARVALDDVSFSIGPQEIVGLLGPNGAGKSTLFRLLCGVYPLQAGRIEFDGVTAAGVNACVSADMRSKLGVVFQDASVDDKLSALQNLRLSGELFGVPREALDERAQSGLQVVGLWERAHDKVSTFSGGMRRRLELVRAMLHRPRFMLMDEPSSGLDEEGFRRFWLFCEDLRSQSKASILLATHRSEEAERCDRLVVLHQGKLIANDTPENLRARVAGDRVMLKLDDHPGPDVQGTWFGSLQTAFPGLEFQKVANEIRVVADVGHSLVPRLIEALPKQAVQSVYVRKPSLADAYLQITGASL